MAKRLEQFPDDQASNRTQQRYPWSEWADGSAWEIRRGEDYDVATENMRVNLHMKATSLGRKVQTRKTSNPEGLVFQFLESEEEQKMKVEMAANPNEAKAALDQLYMDAVDIYETAREEVMIPRKDGTQQKYAANRFKQQIDKGHEEGMIVPTIARIVRRPTEGFAHLKNAGRQDLMVENLVIDPEKPYHRYFAAETIQVAERRMAEFDN
jgi:hypothetical protein